MQRLSEYASRVVLGVVIATVIGGSFIIGLYLPSTASTNSTVTTTSPSTTTVTYSSTRTIIAFSGAPPQNCLYEIPANASATLVSADSNTSVPEFVVGFGNGTTVAFPENSCPQPVYPQLYSLASVVVQSPSFIAAENGSLFLVEAPGISMISNSSQGISSVVIYFAHWSNQTYSCGTYSLKLLGLLQVSIPYNQTSGTYDFSNMMVYSASRGSPMFTCIYMPTTVATVTTVTSA